MTVGAHWAVDPVNCPTSQPLVTVDWVTGPTGPTCQPTLRLRLLGTLLSGTRLAFSI